MENSSAASKNVPFQPGEKLFEWRAFDYHPHERGWIWIGLFSLVIFGGGLWAIIDDPQWGWTTATVLFLAAALYFWSHRKGSEEQDIEVFSNGVVAGGRVFPREQIEGYWFVYDRTVSVVNLELKSRAQPRVTLQMGEHGPDFFRQNFRQMEISELPDKKESLTDLWIRALKL